ncbi:MAG: glucose-6-phosphate isomerase, partial [Eubacteriales bacterium]|nr:glucose-6-phosphate isomerase [Eubacteriales bacterium]
MIKKPLGFNYSDVLISEDQLLLYKSRLIEGQMRLNSGKEDFTGWVRLPFTYDSTEVKRIQDVAAKIQQQCDAFVLIGIGGSYLGARSAIEILKSSKCDKFPTIYYGGHNLSGTYHAELLEEIRDKDFCLCVISKSGT